MWFSSSSEDEEEEEVMIHSNGVTTHFAIAALRLTDDNYEKPPKPETRIINDHWKKTPKVSVKIEGINHEYDLMYLGGITSD